MTDIRPPWSAGEVAHDVLEAAYAPAQPLADVDGITVALVTVELWTERLFVRLAGMRTLYTDELDAEFVARIEADPRAAGEQPGSLLARLPLTVSDDIGTRYVARGRSAGGTGTEWRAEWAFEPGVPRAATRLMIALEASGGERYAHEIEIEREED